MRHSVWHHAALAAGSSRRAARQREGCEARGRQAVRQTRDSGPRSQGPPRPTKQEINHLHLGGCFRNALLLLSVLHTLVNAMKPGNPRATSSAALRAASRSWGTGQRFCICRCRRSCTVRPGRGRTRNRPLARSNDNLLVPGSRNRLFGPLRRGGEMFCPHISPWGKIGFGWCITGGTGPHEMRPGCPESPQWCTKSSLGPCTPCGTVSCNLVYIWGRPNRQRRNAASTRDRGDGMRAAFAPRMRVPSSPNATCTNQGSSEC